MYLALQSAFPPLASNYLVLARSQSLCSTLNLFAAFDTVDHMVLLEIWSSPAFHCCVPLLPLIDSVAGWAQS